MEKSPISTNNKQTSKKLKQKKNLIIREKFVRYNAHNLYDNDTTFRLPDYLINVINQGNRNLIFCHKGKTVCIYTHKELLDHIETISNVLYEGIFNNNKIVYNLAVIKLKQKNESKNS